MVNNKKRQKLQNSEVPTPSTEQVLEEIAIAVTQEKTRRKKIKKKGNLEVFELGKDIMVKSGAVNQHTPMPQDLATLKSLIQTIVREEMNKNQKD